MRHARASRALSRHPRPLSLIVDKYALFGIALALAAVLLQEAAHIANECAAFQGVLKHFHERTVAREHHGALLAFMALVKMVIVNELQT